MSLSKIKMLTARNVRYFFRRTYSNAVIPQVPSNLPTIKVPKYVENYIEKAKKREFAKQLNMKSRRKIAYRGDTSKPVISSNIGDYNHYLGQLYNERYVMPLQSRFWFKPKSSGQKFTFNSYDSNPSLPSNDPLEHIDDVYFPNDFSKMNLSQDIIDTLSKNFNYKQPTRIQTLVIPRLLSNNHMLIASETGGGKTIAYLAPIIDQLSSFKKTTQLFPSTPLGLIIAPGRELAEQIANVAHKLAFPSSVNVKLLITGGTKLEHLRLFPDSEVDLLVATLGSLTKLFSKNKIHLANLKFTVLDEADTLTDDSFIGDTKYLLQRCIIKTRNSNVGTQLILASSIYPSNADELFDNEFDHMDLVKVRSPYLHRIPAHIEQRFWRVNNDNRAGEVLALIKQDYEKKKPVLIFCNKSLACDWLHLFLQENGIENGKFHAGMNPAQRSKIFRDFQDGTINVLCCTDLASRGLDTQRVKHVVNFDFSTNVSDYLLRIGRVGRVGSNHGRVTNLICDKSGVFSVNSIETAIRKAERLPDVDSNIKQKIKQLYFSNF